MSKDYKQIFLNLNSRIKFIYNSNAIEGSTVTLGQTKAIISGNTKMYEDLFPGEISEVNGLNEAIEYMLSIFDEAITVDNIATLHYKLMRHVNEIWAGDFREASSYTVVRIEDGKEVKHYYLEWQLIEQELNKLDFNKSMTLEECVELKRKFIQIHPFVDGNGRTSRLLLNWLLIRNNLEPVDISGSSKEDRDTYIRAMSKTNGDNPDYTDIIELVKESIVKQNNFNKSNLF